MFQNGLVQLWYRTGILLIQKTLQEAKAILNRIQIRAGTWEENSVQPMGFQVSTKSSC